MTPEIKWDEGAYDGDNRRLAICGKVAIGAVFLLRGGSRYVRWRVWCCENMNPAEGTARNTEDAKREVERRFYKFLMLAGIMTPQEWVGHEKA
jgi:hypothetical protein